MKKTRLASVVTVGALVAGIGALFPASAQAATTYWTFKNDRFGTCVTAGDTSAAFGTTCSGSYRQQWDWVGSGTYKQLKNRDTGRCLMTDAVSNVNAVWMSDCDSSKNGQLWFYHTTSRLLFANVGGATGGYLRTSDIKDALYTSEKGGSIPDSYFQWAGTHN